MDGPVCVNCMSPEKWCSCQPTGTAAVSQIGFYDVPSIQASLQVATLEGERDQLREENEKLRTALSARLQQVEELRAALQRYGRHRLTCPKSDAFPLHEGQAYVCDCGFEAACPPREAVAGDLG